MSDLENVIDNIRQEMEITSNVRNEAYQRSRTLTSLCAKTIRAIHRAEWDLSQTMLAQTTTAAQELISGTQSHPEIYFAGYTQDALKEYVEAKLVYCAIRHLPFPPPAALGVESRTWLNGLAEAATELRRRILDIMRHGHSEEVETLLSTMDEIYAHLTTIDFNDTITGGLRRRTDVVRSVLERTRGDVTSSLRQTKLEAALKGLESKLNQT